MENKLSEEEVKRLFEIFDDVNWNEIASDYPTNYSDLPTVILSFRHAKINRKVTITGERPEVLNDLIRTLVIVPATLRDGYKPDGNIIEHV